LHDGQLIVKKAPKTQTMIAAALVTVPR